MDIWDSQHIHGFIQLIIWMLPIRPFCTKVVSIKYHIIKNEYPIYTSLIVEEGESHKTYYPGSSAAPARTRAVSLSTYVPTPIFGDGPSTLVCTAGIEQADTMPQYGIGWRVRSSIQAYTRVSRLERARKSVEAQSSYVLR